MIATEDSKVLSDSFLPINRADNLRDFRISKIERQLAARTHEQLPGGMPHYNQAARAVCTFVIATPTLPFEKCAPILCKAFRNQVAFSLLLVLANALFRLGEFALKIFQLIIECRHSVELGVSFAEVRRGGVFPKRVPES